MLRTNWRIESFGHDVLYVWIWLLEVFQAYKKTETSLIPTDECSGHSITKTAAALRYVLAVRFSKLKIVHDFEKMNKSEKFFKESSRRHAV